MKKIIFCLIACYCLIACNQEGKNNNTPDTTRLDPMIKIDTKHVELQVIDSVPEPDFVLMDLSIEILNALKKQDVNQLTKFIHPELKLRFSPYGFIDTNSSKAFTPYELTAAFNKSPVFTWGSYDGSGDPIKMNIRQYFNKFVYNKDYLSAPQKSTDEFRASGNSLNNLKEIYPGDSFTEFYFPGFDAKYNGMDWQTLRLVFRHSNQKTYLIAIIHDQWTT